MKDSLDLCNKFGLNLILFFWYYLNEKMFIFSIMLGVLIRRLVKCNDQCYFNWLSAWLSAKVPN